MKKIGIVLSISLCLILLSTSAFAQGLVKKSCGQTVYVPGFAAAPPGEVEFGFTRPIFRNVDPDRTVTITSLAGYDNEGEFVEEFLEGPVPVEPWHSYSAIRMEAPPYGGPPGGGRPFFILEWEANEKVITPNITGQVTVIGFSNGPSPGTQNMILVPGIVIEQRWYCGNKGKKD